MKSSPSGTSWFTISCPVGTSRHAKAHQEMSDYLDRQHDRALAEFEELRVVTKALESALQALRTFLVSDEFATQAEREWLRQSRLVLLLERTLEQHADSDGCVLLNVAGQLLRQHAPEDYAAMRMHYGFKSLKPLILAVGVFEIIEETTASGGTRISSGEGLPRRAVRLVFVTDGRIPAARSRQ